jgi:V/A-type H+-transporting ATPase subunit A
LAVILKISGPVVEAEGLTGAKMFDVVRVADEGLIGEVIRLSGDVASIQVYEDTAGIRPGEKVVNTGTPLSAELAPGLATSIFDGIQRPLQVIQEASGNFIRRGVVTEALDKKKKWKFVPTAKKGERIEEGDILGVVQETPIAEHRILCPVGSFGTLEEISEGEFTIEEPVFTLKLKSGESRDFPMLQRWEVRRPRPYKQKLQPDILLTTGQRVIDAFFPIARGGTACIPGPFGSGKCVPAGTPVLLANGRLVPIEEIYANADQRLKQSVGDEEEIIPIERLSVLSFDGKKIVSKPVSHVYKGKTSRVVRIVTSSGRKVTVTPIHKLVRFRSNGQFEETSAQELAVGDYLAVPRKIPVTYSSQEIDEYEFLEARVVEDSVIQALERVLHNLSEKYGSLKALALELDIPYSTIINYSLKRNNPTIKFVRDVYELAGLERPRISEIKLERHSAKIKVPEKVDENFAEFLGLLLSDGMIAGREIRFFNNEEALLSRFRILSARLFGLHGSKKKFRTVRGVSIHSTALVAVLKSLGFPLAKKSQNARIPTKVMASSDAVVAAFIRGYYLGDGSFSGGTVEFSSASPKLLDEICYALSRLGIVYWTSKEGSKHRRVAISSCNQLSKFAVQIFSFASVTLDKVRKVGSIRNYLSNTVGKSQSRDIVPLDADTLYSLFSRNSVYNYTVAGEHLGAYKFAQLIQNGRGDGLAKIQSLVEALEWIVIESIRSINVMDGDQTVYDITVPDTHNFIGGHVPMILHNTVAQQQLAKWSDANMIVYVGCGERGNEMTEVLTTFPELEDPRTKRPLMERTILIANTSNMPVAAREASIYTGITIAEYYRDMGLAVALMADSTSRWAEALREISGRLEEMPGEEGYPAYLGRRLAEFYERAGSVITLGSKERFGSVSVIGAVSPPGGDISEPVSQNTLRVTRAFWGLDASLASRRHFPAINWLTSYSLYKDTLKDWYGKNVSPDWVDMQSKAMLILQQEAELQEIVQLVGPDALPERERAVLDSARMIREDFLQQSAYHEVDTFTSFKKDYLMMRVILRFSELEIQAVEAGVPLSKILGLKVRDKIGRMKEIPENASEQELTQILRDMEEQFKEIRA